MSDNALLTNKVIKNENGVKKRAPISKCKVIFEHQFYNIGFL